MLKKGDLSLPDLKLFLSLFSLDERLIKRNWLKSDLRCSADPCFSVGNNNLISSSGVLFLCILLL